jgi:hypothetical protein
MKPTQNIVGLIIIQGQQFGTIAMTVDICAIVLMY